MTKNIVTPKGSKRPFVRADMIVKSFTTLCSAAWLAAVTVDQVTAALINVATLLRSGT